jgi:hypothetical protein
MIQDMFSQGVFSKDCSSKWLVREHFLYFFDNYNRGSNSLWADSYYFCHSRVTYQIILWHFGYLMSEDASFSTCDVLRSLCPTLRLEDFKVSPCFYTTFYLFRNDANPQAPHGYIIIYGGCQMIWVVYWSPSWRFDMFLLFPIDCLVYVYANVCVKTRPRHIDDRPYIGFILRHMTVEPFQPLSLGRKSWHLMSYMCIHGTLRRAWTFMTLNITSGHSRHFILKLNFRDR